MKNVKKEAVKLSKMSLAALKGWETRRKRYGIVKKKPSEQPDLVIEQWKSRGRKSRGEQLKGYRNGQLMVEGKSEMRKSSVKMDEELREFLWGQKYLEEIMIRKLFAYSKKLAKQLIWQELTGEIEAPKVLM